MDKERYILLGRYVESLSNMERSMAGHRINVAVAFLQSEVKISNKGKKEFLARNPIFTYGAKRELLNDFLYFAGVKMGPKRKEKIKILEKKEVISERNNTKISEFLIRLKDNSDLSEKTLEMYRYGIDQYFKYADEFNQELARRFIATLEEKGYSPKTVNLRILCLQKFGEFFKIPIDIKKRKIASKHSVENVPTEAEVKFALNYTVNRNPDTYWIIRLLSSTGMRLSELLKIQWKHVIDGEAYIKCKGSKYRPIYFPKYVGAEAREFVKSKGIVNLEQFVMANRKKGECITGRGVSQRLYKFAEESGFPKEKAHCHAFRHFFAKMYLKKTKDIVRLAELLGHESVDTTRIYLQKSKAEQIKDINQNVTW